MQGGTFHLLPAGTPIPDTSRVLQNRKLGLLITQFRQIYDLVIIDSPPVLPVPDALILGRWADGAVLAVRYDTSRFPQVERARRQLDGAGIAVLGTVINGMKNSDSYYGRYSYSRRRSSQAGFARRALEFSPSAGPHAAGRRRPPAAAPRRAGSYDVSDRARRMPAPRSRSPDPNRRSSSAGCTGSATHGDGVRAAGSWPAAGDPVSRAIADARQPTSTFDGGQT